MSDKLFKVTVCFESRPDGGLRAYSPEVPGMVLSHRDVDDVLEDVATALKLILESRLGGEIEISPLGDIRAALEHNGIVEPQLGKLPAEREYVAALHH